MAFSPGPFALGGRWPLGQHFQAEDADCLVLSLAERRERVGIAMVRDSTKAWYSRT